MTRPFTDPRPYTLAGDRVDGVGADAVSFRTPAAHLLADLPDLLPSPIGGCVDLAAYVARVARDPEAVNPETGQDKLLELLNAIVAWDETQLDEDDDDGDDDLDAANPSTADVLAIMGK